MSEENKSVYKTGDSLGSILSANESIASAPVQPPTPEPAPPTPDPVAPPVIANVEPAPVVEAPAAQQEANVSNFTIPDLDLQPTAQEPTPQPITDWKDAIKKADRVEILKELGFNEFAIELNEHIKNGGNPEDYLSAKAVDYNKISDTDIIKNELRKQYPSFTSAQINLLFEDQYSPDEEASDREKELKELRLQADAYNKRQALISEQQKFKIPAPTQVDNGQAAQAEQQKQIDAARQWFAEHEATKSLITSKRVALNLGDNGTFNFSVERPDLLMKAITDAGTWQKLTLNKQGEPDVAKMQKIALYAFNPEQYESDLVNYGKSLALPQVLKEGQNVTPPAKVMPMQSTNIPEKEKWRTEARSSTIGGR